MTTIQYVSLGLVAAGSFCMAWGIQGIRITKLKSQLQVRDKRGRFTRKHCGSHGAE